MSEEVKAVKEPIRTLIVKQKSIKDELARSKKTKKLTELSKKRQLLKPLIDELKTELTAHPLPLHVLIEDADFLYSVTKNDYDEYDVLFDLCRLDLLKEIMSSSYNYMWMAKSYRKELEEIYADDPEGLNLVYKLDKDK